MEALPGIAHVLRSPVADAFIGLISAATGQSQFDPAHAEEVMRYAVRRNLLGAEESVRVLAEARAALAGRAPAPVEPKKRPTSRKPIRKRAGKPNLKKGPRAKTRKGPTPKRRGRPARKR
jgi:hypothetical protein